MNFQVAFSEAVTGVDVGISRCRVAAISRRVRCRSSSVNGSIYNVTVSGIVGNGTLGLDLLNNATIQSLAGIPLPVGKVNNQLTFTPAATYTASAQPGLVVVADLNGDGFLDLATASYSSAIGSVLLGNGNGGFQPRKTFATTATGGTSIGAGDFNGDGKIDLIVTLELSSRINLLAGDGNGGFQLLRTAATGSFPVDLQVGDFNKDGKLGCGDRQSERQLHERVAGQRQRHLPGSEIVRGRFFALLRNVGGFERRRQFGPCGGELGQR